MSAAHLPLLPRVPERIVLASTRGGVRVLVSRAVCLAMSSITTSIMVVVPSCVLSPFGKTGYSRDQKGLKNIFR